MKIFNFVFRRRTTFALSLTTIVVALLLMYAKTLQWPFGPIDSPIILAQAIAYTPLEYFSSPHAYQFLTYNNFTPWATFSWDVDHSLFQLEPFGYRVHQLLALAVMIGVVYAILFRLTKSILITTIFSLAVLSSPATVAVVDDPMNRHYMEGMIFCLLSYFFAALYNGSRNLLLLLISVLFYALSLTAKEVYVVLPGILFFMIAPTLRERIFAISPYAFVLTAYLVWRVYMLGGTGGYVSFDSALMFSRNFRQIAAQALALFKAMFGNQVSGILVPVLFILLLITNFARLRLDIPMAMIVAIVGLALPILTLLPLIGAGLLNARWVLAPTVTFLLFFAYLCSLSRLRTLVALALSVVLVSGIAAVYKRVQAPLAYYFGSASKEVSDQILRSDAGSYLEFGEWSEHIARNYAAWVYVAKLQNDSWGTLVVSDPGQLLYHDVKNKSSIPMSSAPRGRLQQTNHNRSELDLIRSGEHNLETDLLTLTFVRGLRSEKCIVYFFGENNGLLFRSSNCSEWSMPLRYLKYLVRMTGYDLSEVAVALWSDDPGKPFYSKPVRFRDLIELENH